MLKPIKTEEDYNLALKRLDEIFLADVNSPEGDEAHILSILIEEYENENYEIEPPDPIEAIKIRLEEMQISNFDLINIFGNEQHKYDILNRKSKLSIENIRIISKKLNIPPKVLIQDYSLNNP